ncbi:MAG: hypothetical protein ACOXZ9_08460 [Bacteroidales bacterium]|jgi:hypothetical protein
MKSFYLWLLAFLITVAAAYFQRVTGPTHSLKGEIEINDNTYKYKLIRSANNDKNAEIKLSIPDTTVSGYITYKRYKSHDTLTTHALTREGDNLVYKLPKLEAAGKIMYKVTLLSQGETYTLSGNKDEGFVVMRYKNPVPAFILIPHILVMFIGMMFSTRTGIEAVAKGKKTYKYAIATLVLLIIGGVLGMLLQKYAFGQYWTGFPFGHDLTDNKTLVLVIIWIITVFKLKKDRNNRFWPIFASILVILIYLIPHSVLGSEIDYTKTENL